MPAKHPSFSHSCIFELGSETFEKTTFPKTADLYRNLLKIDISIENQILLGLLLGDYLLSIGKTSLKSEGDTSEGSLMSR